MFTTAACDSVLRISSAELIPPAAVDLGGWKALQSYFAVVIKHAVQKGANPLIGFG